MNARRILVTGSSRGIGLSIAKKLASDGFHVVVHGRDHARLMDIANAINSDGGSASLLAFDIGDRSATRAALEQELAEHGAFYGVVCNAGIARDNAFPAMTEEDWDSVLHTNLDGFFNVLQPLTMPMVRAKKGGRIVTLSSVSGIAGNRGQDRKSVV